MNTFHNTTLIVLFSMLVAALMSENTIVTATLTTASSQASKTEAEASLEDEVNEIDLLDFLDEERLLMSSDDMNMTGSHDSHDGNTTDDEMDWGTPSSAPIRVGVSGVVVVVAALAAATGMFL